MDYKTFISTSPSLRPPTCQTVEALPCKSLVGWITRGAGGRLPPSQNCFRERSKISRV